MAQTVILAAGQNAATSLQVTVASGGGATLSIQAPAGQRIPGNIGLPVYLVQQGGVRRVVFSLSALFPVWAPDVPGVFEVDREDISAYGVDITVLADQ